MTFEEMQQIIQDMLQVQRELQESQVKQSGEIGDLKGSIRELSESIEGLRESIANSNRELRESILETNRNVDRLVGYNIRQESTSLNIQLDVIELQRRVTALEQRGS